MPPPQHHRVVRSDISSDLEPKIYHPQPMTRSDVSSDSKLEIFLTHPMRRSDVSSDEDEVIR